MAVEAAAGEVAAAVNAWVSAHTAWLAVISRRQRAVDQAERRVVAATRGLGVAGWEAACRRRRIRSAAEARAVAMAVRARLAVESALAEQARVIAEHDAAVRQAEATLATASQVLVDGGSLAADLCGVTAGDLRRAARRAAELGDPPRVKAKVRV